MGELLRRYRRPAGAHRTYRPGPFPVRPMFDPWGPIIVLDEHEGARLQLFTTTETRH